LILFYFDFFKNKKLTHNNIIDRGASDIFMISVLLSDGYLRFPKVTRKTKTRIVKEFKVEVLN